MTLKLELTPEQEEQLAADAAQHGTDTQTYALRCLFGTGPDETPQRMSLADRLLKHGILGAIEGKPRADGRNRSEIEAAADVVG